MNGGEGRGDGTASIHAGIAHLLLKLPSHTLLGWMGCSCFACVCSHIFRLDSQLEERNKELLATQQQLARATRLLQEAADELDASNAAATAQQ